MIFRLYKNVIQITQKHICGASVIIICNFKINLITPCRNLRQFRQMQHYIVRFKLSFTKVINEEIIFSSVSKKIETVYQ